jgi:hypothetical protein
MTGVRFVPDGGKTAGLWPAGWQTGERSAHRKAPDEARASFRGHGTGWIEGNQKIIANPTGAVDDATGYQSAAVTRRCCPGPEMILTHPALIR